MKETESYQIESPDLTEPAERSPENGRIAWMQMYEQTGNVRLVCATFGISKKTFYKWLKRYRQSGKDPQSLEDRSRRPHRCPNSTPESVVFLLRQARKKTGFGQRRLKVYMAKCYNIRISERTIWKILRHPDPASKSSESKSTFDHNNGHFFPKAD